MKNLPKINPSKALKASLPYLIAGLLCTKLGEAYRLTTGGDVIDRLLAAFTKLGLVFQNPFPSLHPFDLLVGAAAAVLLRLVVWSKIKNAKKYRHGEEYGTARWGNEKDIAPFINSDFSQNILLTDTERLTLGKIADPEKRNVNLNVLVIGGSGSGKTRYHIKPNLLQMNASYVCSDPKGTVVEEVGRALVQQGHYKLKILNTIDFGCSMHYNPFHYLHSETDIPNWEHLVSVIRSRNISAHIVLQTYSQLKGMYRDNAETIAGCCSSLLFLGGKEESSLKMVATMLGKETIDTYNTSDTRGTSRSYGLNYQKLGKELKSVDELAVMPSSRCILQVQGVRPFYSRKYDLTRHPMYRYTADANPKYTLDVKGYLAHRLKVKPEDEFEVYDLGEADSISAA